MTRKLSILKSNQDASVNFVETGEFEGSIEARFVRRNPDYFVVYLSSQTGCNKACRFCHLTQTGQTSFVQVDLEGFLRQADQILHYYDTTQPRARVVHFDFMARGEVLANPSVLDYGDQILGELAQRAVDRGLFPRYKLSTIMPEEMVNREIYEVFSRYTPDIHYSLYSVNRAFRKRWMPKAMDAELAIDKLVRWQQRSAKIVKLHWAFIEGANDKDEDVEELCYAVRRTGLHCDVNIVRYNPYSSDQGREPPLEVIKKQAAYMTHCLPGSNVKIVERVGYDVKASCGMFVG